MKILLLILAFGVTACGMEPQAFNKIARDHCATMSIESRCADTTCTQNIKISCQAKE